MSIDFTATSAPPPSDAESSMFAPTPVWARQTSRRQGPSAAAVVVGIVAMAALGGAIGWYASGPHYAGLAQLTPGSTATSSELAQTAAVPAPPLVTPDESAPPPAANPTDSKRAAPATDDTRRAKPRPTARARPATSSSANDSGANTGAIAPAEPLPSSRAAPAPGMAVNPPVTSGPSTVAPAPADAGTAAP